MRRNKIEAAKQQATCPAALKRLQSGLVPNRRISAAIQHIHLRVPEIDLRLVVLGALLLLTLNLRHSLLLLVSHPCRLICGLTADQHRTGRDQRKELKLFHIWLIITRSSALVTYE